MRAGLFLGLALSVATIALLLTEQSREPRFLGRYSTALFVTLLVWLAQAFVALAGLPRLRRDAGKVWRLWTSPCAVVFSVFALAMVIAVLAIGQLSGDPQFAKLAALLAGSALGLAWALSWIPDHARRFLPRALLAAAMVAFAAILAEIALRLIPGIVPDLAVFRSQQIARADAQKTVDVNAEHFQAALIADDELGFRRAANATFLLEEFASTGRSASQVTTDAWGFLTPDFDPGQPYDIVCIGDSFVAGPWPGELRELSGLRVANMGTQTYSPPQYTVVLRRYASRLRTGVVLYCLYLNDAVEAADYADWRALNPRPDWFDWRGGQWHGAASPHPGRRMAHGALTRASMLYNLGNLARAKAKMRAAGQSARPLGYEKGEFKLVFDRGSYEWYADPGNPRVGLGMAAIDEALAEAVAIAREASVALHVLLFPPKELIYLDALREVAPAEAPLERLAEFQRRLADMAGAHGLPVYDMTDDLRAAASASPEPLYYEIDTHWNPWGNRIAAELILNYLRRHSLVRPAES